MAGQFRYVGRVADGDVGDDPGDVADIVRTAAFRLLFRRLQLFELGGKAINLLGTHILLDELGESLFALGPFGQAHSLDIGISRLRDRAIEMARRGSADDAAGDRRAGHLRGAFRDLVVELEILLDAVEILLAEIVPDRGDRRYDVRLIDRSEEHTSELQSLMR